MSFTVMNSTPSMVMELEASTPRLIPGLSAFKRKVGITTSEATKERFQHSFGAQLSDLGGRSRWILAGFALQDWQEDLRERLGELLHETEGEIYKGWSIRDTSMACHCWMLGYERLCAYPTVVVSCNIPAILKRTMRIILRHGIVKSKGFELKGLPGCDLRLLTMAMSDHPKVRLTNDIGKSLGGSLKTLCGTGIVVEGSDRPATLGGVIIVGNKYYGLTVAHMLYGSGATSEEPKVIKQETQLYDSDWAEDSSSDDDDEENKPYLPQMSFLKQKDREEIGNAVKCHYDNTEQYAATLGNGRAHLGNLDCGDLHIVAVSSQDPFRRSEDCSYDTFDWALIELGDPKYHCVNGIISPPDETEENSFKLLLFKGLEDAPPAEPVFVSTRNGVLRGMGTGSACLIKLPNSDVYRNVWTVDIERELGVGDSGSWVANASTGKLYGTIIAGSSFLRESYIVPATEIIGNIKHVTRARVVKLPTVQDVLCVAARHGNNDLIQSLKLRGADVNKQDTFGTLPLVEAAQNYQLSTVYLLLGFGASPRRRDRKGQMSLNATALSRNPKMAQLLGGSHADKENYATYATTKASEIAATEGYMDVVRILLSAGPNVNAFTHGAHNVIPLHSAAASAPEVLAMGGGSVVQILMGGIPVPALLIDPTELFLPQKEVAQPRLPSPSPNKGGEHHEQLCHRTSTFPTRSGHTSSESSTAAAFTKTSDLAPLTSRPSPSNARHLKNIIPLLLVGGTGGALTLTSPFSNPSLECPFNLIPCVETFSHMIDWIKHSLTHFATVGPPDVSQCCFCDAQFKLSPEIVCWGTRMEHVAEHHRRGCRLAHARPDIELYTYLWNNELISYDEYKDIMDRSEYYKSLVRALADARKHCRGAPPSVLRYFPKSLDEGVLGLR